MKNVLFVLFCFCALVSNAQKITALPTSTITATADLLPIVKDPFGTPVTKSTSVNDFFNMPGESVTWTTSQTQLTSTLAVTATTPTFSISGNLGVGTTSPTTLLHVKGNYISSLSPGIRIESDNGHAGICFNNPGVRHYSFINGYNTAAMLELLTGTNGTTGPTTTHITYDGARALTAFGMSADVLSGLTTTTKVIVNGNQLIGNSWLTGTINAPTDGLAVYGGVGIGIAVPTAKINVKGSGATSATYTGLFENSSGTDIFTIRDDGASFFGTSSSSGRAIIYNSGNNHLSLSIPSGIADRYLLYLNSSTEDVYYVGNNISHLFYAGGGGSDLVMTLKGGYSSSGRVSICPSTSPNYLTNKFYSETSTANDYAVRGTILATSGTNYASYFDATGSGATENISCYLNSTGATTNVALKVASGRVLQYQSLDVASSSTITITSGNTIELTGTTSVNFITTTGWQEGSEITIIANESVTINDDAGGGNIRLAGNANFAMTADDVLTLVYSSTTAGGAIWREKSRSVN